MAREMQRRSLLKCRIGSAGYDAIPDMRAPAEISAS